jgi:hypothetical protein
MRVRPTFFRALLLCAATSSVGNVARAEPPASAAPGFVGFHVEPMPLLSPEQKAALGVTGDKGVVVALVVKGGPADLAGMRVGDFLVRFAGKDLPQPTWTDRYVPAHHEWRVAVRRLLTDVKAGAAVEAVVDRAGRTSTLSLVPAGEADFHRMQGGGATFPKPEDAAPAEEARFDFAASVAGALPDGFVPWEGRWQVVPEPAASTANAVLRQDMTVLPWAALLITGKGRVLADGSASARFRPLSGVADASGGVVFRAQDGKTYYLARANALEDNFGLYRLDGNVRTELKAIRVKPPALGAWHTIEVRFEGTKFRATLDGKDSVEATDSTYASGWCGLWTKADSVTLFDDVRLAPSGARPE